MKSFGATAGGCAEGVAVNKGRVLADDDLGFYALADGVRGHPSGGRAAEIALERAASRIRAAGPIRGAAALTLLQEVVQDCSRAVHEAGIAAPGDRGMSAALSMVWIVGDRAHIAHVGHSGVHMARMGRLHRLSRDHSVAMELVEMGLLEPAGAVDHPMSRVLTRAVGMQEAVLPDTLSIELVPGDRFILSAAGAVEAPDKVVEAMARDALARALVDATLARNQRDWSNAVVVEILSDADADAGGRDALAKLDALKGMFLFRALDMSELARVLESSVLRRAEAGDMLIREGSREHSLYLILDGELEVIKNGVVLARFGKGGHVGEMALVSGAPRSASVRATRPTRFLEIHREQWEGLLHRAPATGVKLLSALSEELSNRLARMNERV
jgi:serine/threonine protein phosphatase PrpC